MNKANSSAHLQPAALGRLREQLPPRSFSVLLDQVMTDIAANRISAISAANEGDIDGLASASHALKGLGASFACPNLADLAHQVHRLCRNGESAEAIDLTLSALLEISHSALAALHAYYQLSQTAEPTKP